MTGRWLSATRTIVDHPPDRRAERSSFSAEGRRAPPIGAAPRRSHRAWSYTPLRCMNLWITPWTKLCPLPGGRSLQFRDIIAGTRSRGEIRNFPPGRRLAVGVTNVCECSEYVVDIVQPAA
jgi:hypothetical protein